MVIVVFEVCGNWRICSFSPAIEPMSRISRLTTVASTGRRMKRSVKAFIGRAVTASAFRRAAAAPASRRSTTGELFCSLIWPAITTRSPAFTPSIDLDALASRLADAHEAALGDRGRVAWPQRAACAARAAAGGARLDDEDVVAIEAVDDGGARQRQHLGRRAAGDGHHGEHARQQHVVGIGEFGARSDIARTRR